MIPTERSARKEPVAPTRRPSTSRLARTGVVAGLIAAASTAGVAAIARAADVPLEVDAQAIPVPAFAWWTLVGAALGVVLARLLRDRRRFIAVTAVATVVSLVPAATAPDDAATTAVLVAAHLIAAAIVVPALARWLPPSDPGR